MSSLIALLLTVANATHRPARAVRAKGSLVGLFSSDDYPNVALANNEEGTVAILLTIGSDGRVTNCKVSMSSMSENLDAATCRILSERARFTPTRDRRGRAVEDSYQQRITWRIPRGTDLIAFANARSVNTMILPVSGLPRCTHARNDSKVDVPDAVCADMVKRVLYDLSDLPIAKTRPVTIVTSEDLLKGDSVPASAPDAFVRRRAARLRIDAGGNVVGCQPIAEAELGGGYGSALCQRADEHHFEPLPPTESNRSARAMVVVGATRVVSTR